MTFRRSYRQFRPPLWALVLVTLACLATARLSVWQYDRAAQKTALYTSVLQASAMSAATLDETLPAPGPEAMQRVLVRGRWQAQRQILVNQSLDAGVLRVNVLTPFATDAGNLLLVNRGRADQGQIMPLANAVPAEGGDAIEISGLWRSLPRAGITLDNLNCDSSEPLLLMAYPGIEDLRCAYTGKRVLDGMLLLSAEDAASLETNWQPGGMQPERHLAYAFQWAALCVAIFITFVVVNLKKTSHE